MHLEAEIVELKDAHGGCDRTSVVRHLEAEIEELRDALGDRDQVEL
jgi:hypothetical protein